MSKSELERTEEALNSLRYIAMPLTIHTCDKPVYIQIRGSSDAD